MKKLFLVTALAASMVMLVGSTAQAAAGAEVVVFQVNCVLPTFPTNNGSTTCGGGLQDVGVGTAFIGVANPAAAANPVNYNEPNCALGNASGVFSIGGASGNFVYDRAGALAVITFASVDGGGFTNASGAALAVFETDQTQKFANACLGTTATNLAVTVTGVGEVADLN